MDKARVAVAFPKLLRPLDHSDTQRCEDIAAHRMELGTSDQGKELRVREASMGLKSGRMLTRLVKYLKPNSIFEIGTCVGIGAAYMCSAAETVSNEVRFVGLELVPEKIALAKQTLGLFCPLTNADIIEGHFDDTFEQGLAAAEPLEFVYLDGRHKKKYTLDMFDRCTERMPYGVIVCDDLRSAGQGNALRLLQRHKRVSTTWSFHHKDVFIIREQ